MNKIFLPLFFLLWSGSLYAQNGPQGFFLDDWTPKEIVSPDFNEVSQTEKKSTVVVRADASDIVTKVSPYIYGDNANPWTGTMTNNPTLMENIQNISFNVIRGPGGSISDVYFWDQEPNTNPDDVPAKLAGDTENFNVWAGKNNDNWTMSLDTFYSLLEKSKATGIITVNYGYARYGTSDDPVAKAAKYAADWVRYDNGRSKFWEIGNEVFGSWEAGYRIDQSLNKDGQPEYINSTLYGQHCKIFIDSMKAAAAQIGVDIQIGVVATEGASTAGADWNSKLFAKVGGKADYYVVHSYFTPYNENSSVETILNAPVKTQEYFDYVRDGLETAGFQKAPVAMTEWNIFAVGSKQQISYINGMFAAIQLGQLTKSKYGLACRWDLANSYSGGDDHGMFSYGDEPGVPKYNPRPVFYYVYYFKKFFGDNMIKTTVQGGSDVIAYSSTFTSGQSGIVLVNKGSTEQVVYVYLDNFKYGDRYYYYTLTGGTDNGDFSTKVYVNGQGPSLTSGGPSDYTSIKASSSAIGDRIKIVLPSLSVAYALVESGDKELPYQEEVVTGLGDLMPVMEVYPNPAGDYLNINRLTSGNYKLEIRDVAGKLVQSDSFIAYKNGNTSIELTLRKGSYIFILRGANGVTSEKLMIN